MNTKSILLSFLAVSLPMALTADQDAPRERPDRPQARERRPLPPEAARPAMGPLMAALDVNRDGVIDAEEIRMAPANLLKLDRNGDRRITPDELRPDHAPARPRPDTPREQRPQSGRPDRPEWPAERPDDRPVRPDDRPVPPLMQALDLNGDGILDAREIRLASRSLLRLDINGDGKLTMDELRQARLRQLDEPPSRPERPGRDGEPVRPFRRPMPREGNP